MKRWSVFFGVVASALTLGRVGHAEEKSRLVYAIGSSVSGCPEEIELRLRVVARLGYDPFSPQASRVVLARVERRNGVLVGSIELVDQAGSSSGRRELFSPRGRCDDLARAMALTISLTIDAERLAAGRVASDQGAGRASDAAGDVKASALTSRVHEVRLFTGANLANAILLLPSWAIGGGAFIGVGVGEYSLRLEARFMYSFATRLPVEGSLSGQTVDPGLAACRSFGPWGLCAVAQLGIERVRGYDFGDPPRAVTAIHGTLGPRVSLNFPQAAGFSWVVGLEPLLNLSRNHARIGGRDVWRSPLVSSTLLVGAETDFL